MHQAKYTTNIPEAAASIEDFSIEMESWHPRKIMGWAIDYFGPEYCALGTGFGLSGVVLSHMVSTLPHQPHLFFLETGFLFPETHDLRSRLEMLLGLSFEAVSSSIADTEPPKKEGQMLWPSNPDQCCFLRKVLPLRNYLSDKKVWMTGLRRDQSITRKHTPVISWDDSNAVWKINPLANWSEKQVWNYVAAFELPYNTLHDAGYPSIGCVPCTRPVEQGSDPRSGRWADSSKTECGIHLPVI